MPRHYPQKTTLTLEPHQVVLRPLVTEKNVHRASRQNAYTFVISALATKTDVRMAIETLFNVKVEKVATQNRKGKPRRTKFRHSYTANWKKAIVTLSDEHRIDFY